MLIAVYVPGSGLQARLAAEPETASEMAPEIILPETESPDDWFKADLFSEGWEIGHVTAPTVFHRKLYTCEDGKAYIKFSTVNKLIKNLDDLILYDTRSCVLRISTDRYIVTVYSKTDEGVAVLGELSSRYLIKNDFNQYNVTIKKASDYDIVSLKQHESKLEGGVETHLDAARGRLNTSWDSYRADIDALFE